MAAGWCSGSPPAVTQRPPAVHLAAATAMDSPKAGAGRAGQRGCCSVISLHRGGMTEQQPHEAVDRPDGFELRRTWRGSSTVPTARAARSR